MYVFFFLTLYNLFTSTRCNSWTVLANKQNCCNIPYTHRSTATPLDCPYIHPPPHHQGTNRAPSCHTTPMHIVWPCMPGNPSLAKAPVPAPAPAPGRAKVGVHSRGPFPHTMASRPHHAHLSRNCCWGTTVALCLQSVSCTAHRILGLR